MFVKTLGMLELDTLTLSLSLKRACVEMQELILADVFIFSTVLCLNTDTNRKHYPYLPHLGFFFHDVRHFDPLHTCVCVCVLCWRKASKERKKLREALD